MNFNTHEADVLLAETFGLSLEVSSHLRKEQAVYFSVIDFEDVLILKDQTGASRWVMVLRDVSENTHWRTQSFDLDGFSGHMIFVSKDEAVESAVRCGFHVVDNDALDRVQNLPRFLLGNFCCDQISKMNAGQITFRQYLESILDYKISHGMVADPALAA